MQRDAFLLHQLEGLDYAEIGKRLGIEIDAVEQHIATALRALRSACTSQAR